MLRFKKTKMENKQQILALLQKSVLVSEESKQKIGEKIHELSEAQIAALLVLLQDAEEKQQMLLKRVLEVHPDFLDVLENYTAKEIEKARIEAEVESQKEEQKTEEDLISQLNNL